MNLRCIQYALRYASLSQLAVFKWWVVGCGSKTGHQDDMYVDEIGLLAQHLLTVLGSIVNIVGRTLWSFNEPEKLHLRQSYELQKLKKNGYSYNLRLSIISHWLCVSYPSRSGCREKSIWWRFTHFPYLGECRERSRRRSLTHCPVISLSMLLWAVDAQSTNPSFLSWRLWTVECDSLPICNVPMFLKGMKKQLLCIFLYYTLMVDGTFHNEEFGGNNMKYDLMYIDRTL